MMPLRKEQVLKRLRAMCVKRTQHEVAEEIGVSDVYLSDVLNGRRDPGPKILTALNLSATTVYEPSRVE